MVVERGDFIVEPVVLSGWTMLMSLLRMDMIHGCFFLGECFVVFDGQYPVSMVTSGFPNDLCERESI